MKTEIKVLGKKPGKPWQWYTLKNNLKGLQSFVEGYIETVTICTDLVLVCNEEGRINAMNYNCTLLGAQFFGPIFLAGVNGEEFTDFPEQILEIFSAAINADVKLGGDQYDN